MVLGLRQIRWRAAGSLLAAAMVVAGCGTDASRPVADDPVTTLPVPSNIPPFPMPSDIPTVPLPSAVPTVQLPSEIPREPL